MTNRLRRLVSMKLGRCGLCIRASFLVARHESSGGERFWSWRCPIMHIFLVGRLPLALRCP